MQSDTLQNLTIATNEFRGNGAAERTEYHNLVAWNRLAEICGQFLSKGQLIDAQGRLQTRQWDQDASVRYCRRRFVGNALPSPRRAWTEFVPPFVPLEICRRIGSKRLTVGNYGQMGRLTRAGANPPSATNPDPRDVLARAVANAADWLAIPDGAFLLLAVSGGPDSMALLHGTAQLAPERNWDLTVAHLDHGLRDDSPDDAAFVAAAAETLGLRWEVRRVDVSALAAAEGRTLEDAGREARYRFFEEIAAPDALIATGHTADDSAETILLNLLRGSGLSGVSGIPARRGRIVRPLLSARRADLRAALDAANIAYLTDPSNADLGYARNRIRHEVLPAIERINPAAVEALLRFGRLAADDDALLDGLAAAELERRVADEGIDWHEPPGRAIGRRILRQAIGDPAPSAERIDALLHAAEGSRGGLTVELGGGREASVRKRIIRLR